VKSELWGSDSEGALAHIDGIEFLHRFARHLDVLCLPDKLRNRPAGTGSRIPGRIVGKPEVMEQIGSSGDYSRMAHDPRARHEFTHADLSLPILL
jgi:hypothetical protein